MKSTKNLVLGSVFLALTLLLPFLTMQIPAVGSMLLPMHIPVLLCGFFCGWRYGLIVGVVAPLLRSVLFGMPPMFPTAAAMAFELAAYGALTGLLYQRFPKKAGYIYATMLISMIGGRIIWGAVSFVLYGIGGTAFSWEMFMGGALLKALPGIALQLVLIPILVMVLNKNKDKDTTLSV